MLFQTALIGTVAGLAAAAAAGKGGKKSQSLTTAAPTPACSPSPTTSADWVSSFLATDAQGVAAAAATALTTSPTSSVKGNFFDRWVYIIFENTDYDKALADPNFKFFAKKGITLTNFFAVTHPSLPNYVAMWGGDYFGIDNDDMTFIDANVSTIVDLLEARDVSWASYQEDMPYSGFEGFQWKNPKTGANDYVRKHAGGQIFNSVAENPQRLSQIKNLSMIDTANSMFHKDKAQNKLAQWNFITPNMTSDGHDTSVTVAGAWLRNFLQPLLTDKNFMKNTAVLISFDENGTGSQRNQILSLLLHDKMPKELKGTTDDTYYNHYSAIASVCANWDLDGLGRWDMGANIFKYFADMGGLATRAWSTEKKYTKHAYNESYAGPFNSGGGNKRYPAPNLKLDISFSHRRILPKIKEIWQGSSASTYYKDTVENNDGANPPLGYEPIY